MANEDSRPPYDNEWEEDPPQEVEEPSVNTPSITEGHFSDLLIDGNVWLSSLGGALINDQPLPTFESKQLPEHTWIEEPGVEIQSTSGMLNATEITLSISIAAEGKGAVAAYTNFVNMLVGSFHMFYFPSIEQTWGSLLFSRTANPQFGEGAGFTFVNFDLTMRMTVPSVTNGKR
ncbi:MAG: hypothetical protein MJZ30_06120 [Paludibacteraceae bacterium]|nr:hypothetical protein [Paludibacteraceae bacterium]